jgi:hypothetical protein
MTLPHLSAAYSPARPLAFMHVPKTSGSALAGSLTVALQPRRTASGFDRVLFGGFDGFETIDPALRSSIHLEPESLPAEADFVLGHMSFSTLARRYGNAQHMTVLREPISRILSHWLYWRTQTDSHLEQWGDWGRLVARSRGPLREFLSNSEIASQTDNLYVRMLLWPEPLIPGDAFIDEHNDGQLLAQAVARLEEFAFVDLVENPALENRIRTWLDRPFALRFLNETPPLPEGRRTRLHEELSDEVFDLLDRRTRLDVKLWQAVASRSFSPTESESLRRRTLMLNIARYAAL